MGLTDNAGMNKCKIFRDASLFFDVVVECMICSGGILLYGLLTDAAKLG
jgi:hypothetical protein